MIKKFATFSLFIFIATFAGVLIVGLVSSGGGNQAVVGSNANSTGQIGNITGVNPSTINLVLSLTELAKHNSGASCWLLISSKIYDVTPYLNSHPGGEAEILKTCGTDATVIYDNRDNTGSHSSRARAMLVDYFIGNLNQILKVNN
jgi:cytochrome b involved in lipid metabolism